MNSRKNYIKCFKKRKQTPEKLWNYSWSLFWFLLITEGALSRLQWNSSFALGNHLFGIQTIFGKKFIKIFANLYSSFQILFTFIFTKHAIREWKLHFSVLLIMGFNFRSSTNKRKFMKLLEAKQKLSAWNSWDNPMRISLNIMCPLFL